MSKEKKKCKLCNNEFSKKENGRVMISFKLSYGEKKIWICSVCVPKLQILK